MERQETKEVSPEGGDKELTPDEVREFLSELTKRYGEDLLEKTGVALIFPSGTMIGEMDVSGKSLVEVLNTLKAKLETYEPPVVQNQEEEQKEEAPEVPTWLKGREDLIWRGAHENPIWRVQEKQIGGKVEVSYVRKMKELKPGRKKMEQGRDVEAVNNEFTLDEWKIAKGIFEKYEDLEEKLNDIAKKMKTVGGEEKGKLLDERKELRRPLMEMLEEERIFRKGKAENPPEKIKKLVTDSMENVAKKTRGFKKDQINIDDLTQRTAEILSQLLVLNRNRGEGGELISKPKAGIKEIPSFKITLERLSECLDNQQKTRKGLALMLGEAGTGKNEAAAYFCAKTNRPFFWFPCGRGMESVDLMAHYEFDTKEGTKRFLTAIAEGIQTPGAVIMVDEVNALKKEVQAMLHGLGDANRSFNYDGINIPVAEGVLIIIAGNPATYGSAGDIGEALLSRTRGESMVADYPALTKGELQQRKEGWSDAERERKEQEDNTLKDYACDEALVLYEQINEFSGLNDEEFALLWDVIVNETTQAARVNELEKNEKLRNMINGPARDHIVKTLIDLRDILMIADAWRKQYEKRLGGLDLIGVSMRDTIAIINAYAKERNVKRVYMKIMDDYRKNPIEGTDALLLALERLIDEKLGSPTS